MNLNQRVKLIKDTDINWDWDGNYPYYYTRTPNSKYGGTYVKFDPFPCYAHDYNLIIKEIEKVEKLFPVEFETFYFIFPFESIGRTNGQASTNIIEYENREKNKKSTWDGVIDFFGKRIPPHPGMTRYLVSHEYSHIIDNWICREMGLEQNGLDKEYAKLRNIPYDDKYGGRKWHSNIGEIIANDIRIVIFNTETEFWPHDCKHPMEDANVISYWKEMKKKYSKNKKIHE